MTESANGTTVLDTVGQVVDATGNVFKMAPSTKGNMITVNGIIQYGTYNAICLYYSNHQVYQEASNHHWWVAKSISNNYVTWLSVPNPMPTESVQGTTVTDGTTKLYDAKFNSFTLTGPGGPTAQIVINGVIDTVTAQVTKLLYWNHQVYQEAQTPPQWWVYGGTPGNWPIAPGDPSAGSPPPPPPASPESPDNTVLTPTTGGYVIDSHGDKWQLTSDGHVVQNGVQDPSAANVGQLVYYTHTVYLQSVS